MRKQAGEAAGEAPQEMAPVVFLRRPSSTAIAAPEVADLILARWVAGASLSQIAAGLHMTPGEVRAVLRPMRTVPDVAEPVITSRAAAVVVLDAIRDAAARTACRNGRGSKRGRKSSPREVWDAIQAQVDQAVADFFGGDYPPRRAGAELDGSAG